MRPGSTSKGAAIVVACFALFAAGCGGGDAPPQPVAVETVCAVDAGTRVEVVGFLRLPERISLTDRAVIDLFTRREGAGDRVSVELVLGTGPNQLERPTTGFTLTSLRARAGDGTVVTLADRVAVTAKVARSGDTCVLRDVQVRMSPT